MAASNFFGSVFARLGTPGMLSDALLALELNRYVILAAIMALIFLLGWPLVVATFPEIALWLPRLIYGD